LQGCSVVKQSVESAMARRNGPALRILDNGSCEPFKAVVHGTALALCALMGLYNAAAWLRRRQPHLAINAAVYLTAVMWERQHVVHHIESCLSGRPECQAPLETPVCDDIKVA
jgi:hypothetical protein